MRKLTLRQLTVLILALWSDLGRKQIGSRAGMTQIRVSQILTRQRKKEIDDEVYDLLLAAVASRRGAVSLTRAFLESLDALETESGLTEEEQATIEEEILHSSGLLRRLLTAFALQSRAVGPVDGYPRDLDLAVCRDQAEERLARLRPVDRRSRLAVVRLGRSYQQWAFVERCCEESVREAWHSLRSADDWARLASVAARFVAGPEGWLESLRGYALAHQANILCAEGKLDEAEARLDEARALCRAGSDPEGVLDPGVLLEVEGSLRRGQGRFEESLSLFDRAVRVSRFPGRVLIERALTQEVLGDYEQAASTLVEAETRIGRDPQLPNLRRLRLARVLSQLSRHAEAAELIEEVHRSHAP